MRRLDSSAFVAAAFALALPAAAEEVTYFPVPDDAGPHDVAPSPEPDGPVWYTAQRAGALGRLDPGSGEVVQIPLGPGSAPHGVIIGPDGAPWVTDGGRNAILRVDPASREVKAWNLPDHRGNVNLNTAAFDRDGNLWFTGQAGIYGRLDPRSGELTVWDAPRGRGPYGITRTPDGVIYYASLAGSYLGRIDPASGRATVLEPPTPRQGARRVWSDSKGQVWVSEWNAGEVARYDPKTGAWNVWKLPGERPRAYAVYVDDQDKVWLSEWSSNAILRFDPDSETFASFPSDRPEAEIRQLDGRHGEVWGAESGAGRLVRISQ